MGSLGQTVFLFGSGLAQLTGALMATGSVMGWQQTNPFHYTRDPMILRLQSPELTLVFGVVTYVLATTVLIPILEARLGAAARHRRAIALGFLPLAGVAAYFISSTDAPGIPADAKPSTQGETIPAAIAIGLAVLTLIGGIIFIDQARKPFVRKPTISTDVANRHAYLAIRDIIKAQSEYVKRDWDGNGKREFALFVAHLWRTARRNQPTVEVGLIPEELAVARDVDFAYNGFAFRNLHQRALTAQTSTDRRPRRPPLRELDYSKEWALYAEPISSRKAEDEHHRLQFLALSDEAVFARKAKYAHISFVPLEPEEQWSPVSSLADIERLQTKPIE